MEVDVLYNMDGDGEPCYYCGELCDSLSANPSLWPLPLCHPDDPGVVKWHHTKCISERIHNPEKFIDGIIIKTKDIPPMNAFDSDKISFANWVINKGVSNGK